jgi:hypothetical protein
MAGLKALAALWATATEISSTGFYTRETKTTRRVMRAKIREIKALIQAADPCKQ